MRILIVVPGQDRNSGNWVTANRFCEGLTRRGHQVVVHETGLAADHAFRQALDCRPDISLLLHAYRSGRPWLSATSGSKPPFAVLLTGTDVNDGLDDPGQGKLIRQVLQRATLVLSQNALIAAGLAQQLPDLAIKLELLRAGVILGTSPYDLRGRHGLAVDQTLFLCPAGLRPIKGLMELLAMFDRLAAKASGFQLAFCGPALDKDYSRLLLAEIEKRSWAAYLGTIEQSAMASAMRKADVILNNSRSEGLPNSLLEAAVIGIPILASGIPGNSQVVSHDVNGLLYRDEVEFSDFATRLLERQQRQRLSCPDPESYDAGLEALALETLLRQALVAAEGREQGVTLPSE